MALVVVVAVAACLVVRRRKRQQLTEISLGGNQLVDMQQNPLYAGPPPMHTPNALYVASNASRGPGTTAIPGMHPNSLYSPGPQHTPNVLYIAGDTMSASSNAANPLYAGGPAGPVYAIPTEDPAQIYAVAMPGQVGASDS